MSRLVDDTHVCQEGLVKVALLVPQALHVYITADTPASPVDRVHRFQRCCRSDGKHTNRDGLVEGRKERQRDVTGSRKLLT